MNTRPLVRVGSWLRRGAPNPDPSLARLNPGPPSNPDDGALYIFCLRSREMFRTTFRSRYRISVLPCNATLAADLASSRCSPRDLFANSTCKERK